jgi:RNA polymerase sigma factor (sigma-70 family)
MHLFPHWNRAMTLLYSGRRTFMMTSSARQTPLAAAPLPQEEILMRRSAAGEILADETRAVAAAYPVSAGSSALDACAEISPEQRDALFLEFAPLMRRLLRQYASNDPEMREDLRGELYYRFTQLCNEFDRGRGVPLRPYLVRKLTAAAYTYARQTWRRDRRELSLEVGEEMGEQGPSIDPTASWDHALAMQRVLHVLPEGISQLPTRQRRLVVARYYEQRSFEEIAESLDIRVATARSILRHGLNNLRKWIQREKLDWD